MMRSRLQQSVVHSNVCTMDDASVRQTAKVHKWRERNTEHSRQARTQTSETFRINYYGYLISEDMLEMKGRGEGRGEMKLEQKLLGIRAYQLARK